MAATGGLQLAEILQSRAYGVRTVWTAIQFLFKQKSIHKNR